MIRQFLKQAVFDAVVLALGAIALYLSLFVAQLLPQPKWLKIPADSWDWLMVLFGLALPVSTICLSSLRLSWRYTRRYLRWIAIGGAASGSGLGVVSAILLWPADTIIALSCPILMTGIGTVVGWLVAASCQRAWRAEASRIASLRVAMVATDDNRSDASGPLIALWDGRAYPQRVLQRFNPMLAECALQSTVLTEHLDLEALRVAARFAHHVARAVCVLIIVGCIFFIVTGGLTLRTVATIVAYTVSCVVVGVPFVSTIFALTRRIALMPLKDSLPTSIRISEGRVSITTPHAAESCTLADVSWFEGEVRDALPLPKWFPMVPALIVTAPMSFGPRKRVSVACGLTSRRMYIVIRGFLIVANAHYDSQC